MPTWPNRWTVIGAGDVTRNMIVPALHCLNYPSERIDVVGAFGEAPVEGAFKMIHVEGGTEQVANMLAYHNTFPIVAVPTWHHLEYAAALNRTSQRFAMVPPLTTDADIVSELSTNSKLLTYCFALDTYGLEQALGLSWLYSPRETWEKYLTFTFEDGSPAHAGDAISAMGMLGALHRADVRLCSAGAWGRLGRRYSIAGSEHELAGVGDLVVPAMTVVAHLFGAGMALSCTAVRVGKAKKANGAATYVAAHLKSGEQQDVTLAVGTHMPVGASGVGGVAVHEKGHVAFSFDTSSATVSPKNGERVRVGVADWYEDGDDVRHPYIGGGIVMSLLKDWAGAAGSPRLYDDLGEQISALHMWSSLVDCHLLTGDEFVYTGASDLRAAGGLW